MKKHILALIAAAFITASLTACSADTPVSGGSEQNSSQIIESTSNDSTSDTSFLENTESETDPNNSSSDFDYDYYMEHRYDNVIKTRGIYGETEIPDIHYEDADPEGAVTHSPFGNKWQYYGLESMVFETHTLGGYTVKMIGHNVRTDKEYFPGTIFGYFGFEVEKDGEMITRGGYSDDLTSGVGAQFHSEELIFTDKIGSYLDVYDLKYPVIAMKYFFGNNPERRVQKCVQFAFLLNNEAVSGFAGVCEPGCGIFWDMENVTSPEAINVVNKGFTNCLASVFEADEFKTIDEKTLFDEEAGITYTFNYDIPMETIKDVEFIMYTAEKTAGSVAAASKEEWQNGPLVYNY